MDFDLLPDILREATESSSSNQLLHDLPSSRLISETDVTEHSECQKSSSSQPEPPIDIASFPTLPISTLAKSEQLDPGKTSNLSYQAGHAISRIEEICEAMTDCIIGRRKQFSICLRSRNLNMKHEAKDSKEPSSSRTITVQFPNSSPREAWKFSRSEALP